MFRENPNNTNYSLSGRYFPNKLPRKKRPFGWKLGLGIGAVILLLTVVFFNKEISNLLTLWGIKAQVPGGPEITLSLYPVEQPGGPTDIRQYTINTKIEYGTYVNAGNLSDPCNPNPEIGFPGCPLPFLGTIKYRVDDLVTQYPDFIESARITVPIENPALPGNDPNNPMITVLDVVDAFGLFTNRRLTPPDLGFITTPPILTVVLKNYLPEQGGGTINFQVSAEVTYLPGLGILYVAPPPGQEPTVTNPIPANGILNLEGGMPDFTLEVIPEFYDSDPLDPDPDPISWGEEANFTIELVSKNGFAGIITLSSAELQGFLPNYFVDYTFAENPVALTVGNTSTNAKKVNLKIRTKSVADFLPNLPPILQEIPFWVDGVAVGIPDSPAHHDNGKVDITYTAPPQDFHLTMDPPTGQVVTTSTGSATYTINVVRAGYLGAISLDALSEDVGHVGDLLDEQPGINAVLAQAGTNIWTLTVAGDGTVFNQTYNFYVRGRATDIGGPVGDRWAPNNPPNDLGGKNPIPASFTIQTTPSYSLSIEPYPRAVVNAGVEAIYTIKAFNPINGFSITENILLTQNILSSPLGAYLTDVHFENGLSSMVITISDLDGVKLHLMTKSGVSLPDPGLPLSVDGRSQVTVTNPIIVTVTSNLVISRLPDFYLTMDPPTDPGAVGPGGASTYIIRVVRDGFNGAVTLTAESDKLPAGQLLENEPGVGTAIFAQDTIDLDKYTLTVTADGFNGNYPFYVRGRAADIGGPVGDRWAPNNPALPHEKNSIPAYFRIQSTPGYTILITPDPAEVDSDAIATYTVTIVNPINGFSITEPILLTQNILNLNSAYLENVYFEGNVTSIETTISDINGGVLLYLDTKPGVNYALPGMPFTVEGHSQITGIDAVGTSHLVINRLPDPDFRLTILPTPHLPINWGDTANFTLTLTNNNTPFRGNVTLTSSQLVGYKTSGYLTDYTFNGISTSLTVAVGDTPTTIALQLLTTVGRTDNQNLLFTVSGLATGIPYQTYHDASSSVAISQRPPAPDFTLTVTPPVHNPNPIYWGDTANFTIELRSENGFNGSVQLASTQLANFKTNGYLTDYTFNGASTTITVALSPGAIVTLPLQLFTATGRTDLDRELAFTVRAVDIANLGNVKTGSATVTVTVRPPDPDFRLTIMPTPHLPINWGDTANFTLTLTNNNTPFRGNVTLTSSQLVGYKTSGYLTDYTFNGISTSLTVAVGDTPTTIALQLLTTVGRTDNQNLLFTVSGLATGIPYQTYHDASSSVLVERVPLPLDFTLLVTPTWQEVNAGGTVEYVVSIVRDEEFAETVQLTNDLLSNYSDYIAQATFNITDLVYGGSDSTILYVTTKNIADSHLISGFLVTGTAVDGAPQHSKPADLQINVVVVPPPPPPLIPDFIINVSPDWQQVDTGGSVDYTVTVTPKNNFTERVILTHNLLSEFGDYIASVDFDTVQLDLDNGYTTTMHVTTKIIVNSHAVTFTVTGTALSGSPIRADDADLQINVAGSPPPSGGGGGGGGGGTYTPPTPTPPAPTTPPTTDGVTEPEPTPSVIPTAPTDLPSTGPNEPSSWFWLSIFVMTWLGWQQLQESPRKSRAK